MITLAQVIKAASAIKEILLNKEINADNRIGTALIENEDASLACSRTIPLYNHVAGAQMARITALTLTSEGKTILFPCLELLAYEQGILRTISLKPIYQEWQDVPLLETPESYLWYGKYTKILCDVAEDGIKEALLECSSAGYCDNSPSTQEIKEEFFTICRIRQMIWAILNNKCADLWEAYPQYVQDL